MTKKAHKKKTPWPTKDAMQQVYDKNLWGTGTTQFFSGQGSHHPAIVTPYIKAVSSFLASFKNPLVVCDLGCGDFNIGKQLVPYTKKYEAVDIVTNLIAHNKETYKDEHLSFYCLDISKDDLPFGDCAIIRQVLQHLSNTEIINILKKLKAFKYVILTEHIPNGDFLPNKDIISGQGTRLKKKSGINLKAAPFYLKAALEKDLVKVNLKDGGGVIETKLFQF